MKFNRELDRSGYPEWLQNMPTSDNRLELFACAIDKGFLVKGTEETEELVLLCWPDLPCRIIECQDTATMWANTDSFGGGPYLYCEKCLQIWTGSVGYHSSPVLRPVVMSTGPLWRE